MGHQDGSLETVGCVAGSQGRRRPLGKEGCVSTTYHNFSIPEHILITSWVKDNATRVGVDPMDV